MTKRKIAEIQKPLTAEQKAQIELNLAAIEGRTMAEVAADFEAEVAAMKAPKLSLTKKYDQPVVKVDFAAAELRALTEEGQAMGDYFGQKTHTNPFSDREVREIKPIMAVAVGIASARAKVERLALAKPEREYTPVEREMMRQRAAETREKLIAAGMLSPKAEVTQ